MDKEMVFRAVASVVTSSLFAFSSLKMLGAMQQSGYKNGSFTRWLRHKDNLFFNRLSVYSLTLVLATAIFALCFSFLGVQWSLFVSVAPFAALAVAFLFAERKFALKVKTVWTGRLKRLLAVYILFLLCSSYLFIAGLGFLKEWNGSEIYGLVSYVPYGVFPIFLPVILMFANLVSGIFENARNKRFVKRAATELQTKAILRIGIVGSYGKTSVKNILKGLLSEKYSVAETPQSYNTPMGIAKTVLSGNLNGKEVFIAEMGARKKGDIAELCKMVNPDYAIFTGVCEQHIASFGSLEKVFEEKSEILKGNAKKVVCGKSVTARLSGENEKVLSACETKNARCSLTGTAFTLVLGGKEYEVTTSLLGEGNMENIAFAATLAWELGLTAEEILRGIEKLQPVAHRLQLLESNGVYILDDGYNCNPVGAKTALAVLSSHAGRKCIVTPGIVECGVLEETLNNQLGAEIAASGLDKVILVGQTLVGKVKDGYLAAGGKVELVTTVKTLQDAQELLKTWTETGDCILFLNDLPDVY